MSPRPRPAETGPPNKGHIRNTKRFFCKPPAQAGQGLPSARGRPDQALPSRTAKDLVESQAPTCAWRPLEPPWLAGRSRARPGGVGGWDRRVPDEAHEPTARWSRGGRQAGHLPPRRGNLVGRGLPEAPCTGRPLAGPYFKICDANELSAGPHFGTFRYFSVYFRFPS